MSKVAIKGADTGTGVFTIESPATNTDRTLTLPDEAGTILTSGGAIDVDASAPADSVSIDASGNLLVGKTTTGGNVEGHQFNSNGAAYITRDGNTALYVNRKTSDGTVLEIRKNDVAVGSIGALSGVPYIANASGYGVNYLNSGIGPASYGGSLDNVMDCGLSFSRWNDVYATNGTIQTSDAREKENIASLTPAEMAVGKRLSSLFKTFTWVDRVRTHTGIIAQDVKAAFEAEGLDAGNYALFIHTEWTDEETGEQRDRMGIRYPELLSFVAAYNDQRFAAIEARLDVLEGGA